MFFKIILFNLFAYAQEIKNNYIVKKLFITDDTIHVDTLSIIPGSFTMYDYTNELEIDTTAYYLDWSKSLLIIKKSELLGHTYLCKYRVFPLLFTRKYFHKDKLLIEPDISGRLNPFKYTVSDKKEDFFYFGNLYKNGSILRGFSIGNRQDVIMNSSLNLQLSGMISEDVHILAAITDNNIPIQPEGNTQQISEFDKVFIQLSNDNNRLVAGDYEIKKSDCHFLFLNKKAQGIDFFNETKTKNSKAVFKNNLSIAISKGKYHRNVFNGKDGIQGPYKLVGKNNELFITILAGTEKVFLDGELLKRGQEYDYIIDYNSAELTFTAKRMISRHSRIIVEFEYSDKSYLRTMLQGGTESNTNNANFKFNFYLEQDSKNQPIQQFLNDSMKNFLSSIGDNVQKAWYPYIVEVPYNDNEILYEMRDTIVNGIHYDSVFVYSTNPNAAKYKLSFSRVGNNKGNYVRINEIINGQIYKWVAPVNGIPQGNYEPVVLLTPPQLKQMYIFSFATKSAKKGNNNLELALSNYDKNLFSKKDDKDNVGMGLKYQYTKEFILKHDSVLPIFFNVQTDYEFINNNFEPIERFREQEFERKWNIQNLKINSTQHITSLTLGITNKKNRFIKYQGSSYLIENLYKAINNSSEFEYNYRNFKINAHASILNSNSIFENSLYIKHRLIAIQKIGKFLLGIKENGEDNKIYLSNKTDSLLPSSFYYTEYESFIALGQELDSSSVLSFKRRWDFFPFYGKMKFSMLTDDISFSSFIYKNPAQQLNFKMIYRLQKNIDTLLSDKPEEKNIRGQFEYYFKIYKNLLTSSTFYETGSGIELKKEYTYLEVTDGKGIYKWNDYNKNGIKELNEFEIANFQDEAKYIKVYVPTNEYIKVYNMNFNEVITFDPYLILNRYGDFRKFLSKFSNRFVYRIEKKDGMYNILNVYSPILINSLDSNVISLSLNYRNTFYFNKNNSKYGFEWSYQESQNKMLNASGFDIRQHHYNNYKLRYLLMNMFTLFGSYTKGIKNNASEYLVNRNYTVDYEEYEPSISIQPSLIFRSNLFFRYTEKKNNLNKNETCISRKLGIEITYKIVAKGSFTGRINYIENNFIGHKNSPIAYEMLEGLNDGKNFTWSLIIQRDISKYLQLNISYEGRKPNLESTIHVGSLQLRAYF